jgi:hypothetical protein
MVEFQVFTIKLSPMETAEKKDAFLIENYIDWILTHNERPKNVYQFTKKIGLEEQEFYASFGSFDGIESTIIVESFDTTYQQILEDKNYLAGNAKEKLSIFYAKYFENLKKNRSLYLFIYESNQFELKSMSKLSELKFRYKNLVENLAIEIEGVPFSGLNELIQKSIPEISWAQFMLILNFWVKDQSAHFEKTDQFIKKSIETGFDILTKSPLEGIYDLGKFLINSKFDKKSN